MLIKCWRNWLKVSIYSTFYEKLFKMKVENYKTLNSVITVCIFWQMTTVKKVDHKMLVKLTTGANYINTLHFFLNYVYYYIRFFHTVFLVKLVTGTKAAFKMLVTSTTGIFNLFEISDHKIYSLKQNWRRIKRWFCINWNLKFES